MSDADAATTVSLTAMALDGQVDLADLDRVAVWPVTLRKAYGRRYDLGDGRFLHVFRFGAIVVEGAEQVDATIGEQVERLTGCGGLAATTETHVVVIDPSIPAPRTEWNRIVVPSASPEGMSAIALLLGESAALERYERAAEALVEESLAIADHLAAKGRPPDKPQDMVRRVGRLTRHRLEVSRWFFIVDRPDVTWDDPDVAGLYDVLFGNLELEERFESVLHKLDTVESCMQATVGLWHERRGHWLEWAIVLLIVLEIVFAVAGVYS